jgi:hypothetical protein
MAWIPPGVRNLVQQVAYPVNAGNFNDYVKYARGALNTGQTPNAAGFQQYYQGLYPQAQPPGGGKQQQPPAAPVAPVTEPGQLNRVPMQQGAAQPMPSMPPKGGRNLQYAAALSRMK